MLERKYAVTRRQGQPRTSKPPASDTSISITRRRIDHAATQAALATMRSCRPVAEATPVGETIALQLTWPCQVLRSHACTLAELGMPVAHLYVASAALSLERAIQAVHAAEGQEGWPTDGLDIGGLADWL